MQWIERSLWRLPAVVLTCGAVALLCGVVTRPARAQDRSPAKDSEAKSAPKAAEPDWQPTHKQVRTIRLSDKRTQPASGFCLTGEDKVLACIGSPDIHVLDIDGKLLETWKLDFVPQVINMAPDGAIYAGGNGKLARLDKAGKVIQTTDLPTDVKPVAEDKDAVAKRQARITELKASLQKPQAEMREIAAKVKDLKTASAKVQAQIRKADGDQEKEKLNAELQRLTDETTKLTEKQQSIQKEVQTPSRELTELQTLAMVSFQIAHRAVTGIAAGQRDVFVACSAVKSFGYEVWRMDRDGTHPKKIITGLRGCCGQMDIQTNGGDLFVANHTAFQVVRYDREGKQLAAWGGRDRKGVESFGSCCNPMNICFDTAGNVYTSESNVGRIKRYTPEGKLLNVVGVAKIEAGCKRVTVAVSADGKRVFMLYGPQICVLEQQEEVKPPARQPQ